MKFYHTPSTNKISAISEDGSQDYLITDEMVLVTKEEAEAIINQRFTQSELDAKRVQEIDTLLNQIDHESVRPLRAINAGTATVSDTGKLASLDAEAVTLRAERATLI